MATRQKAYRFGVVAEYLAMIFLTLKGYQIVGRRFKTPVGELDIIAVRGKTLCFVEVKARKNHRLIEYTVRPSQQQRIVRGAEYFLAHKKKFKAHNIRFDVIFISRRRGLQHLKHAFWLNKRGHYHIY